MLKRLSAAALLLALGACTVGPNFEPPELAVPHNLVRQEGGSDPAGTQHGGGRTDRSELVEPVQRSDAHRAGTPRRRRKPRCAGRHRADRRIPCPTRRGGRGAVPDAQRQRLLHTPEVERCRRVLQLAQRSRGQRRPGQQCRRHSRRETQRIRCLSGGVRCLVGSRPVGQGATLGGIRHRLGGGVGRGAAGNVAVQSGGTRARLHTVARCAVAVAASHATM